ncbi:hypothetical protein PPL_02602 [Heterostelium album PN500]|uniref:Uncharacterized protein n=1 Tax=Heterostelium pallidum (strain ATCC 26659 / Pp 5 / PN500) TaxID=670386 RepID=D3B2I9_HETP5|nr:hypothetical protein PPL_02602 [Heterostelium album PN500]EFA83537.1 hypothetical protein PPL_02602 [Heterostelium album PN500]|eukprot:XP_020435654.1 hypothetical protein PPL_02602 [Heterostelium album PN500]
MNSVTEFTSSQRRSHKSDQYSNNNNENNNEHTTSSNTEEDQNIKTTIEFKDRTLLNMIRAYDLYYKLIDSFVHYFDEVGFSKFVVDVFFDRSNKVFDHSSMSRLYTDFNDWFKRLNQDDNVQLKFRIDTYRYIFKFRTTEITNNSFNYFYLYQLVYENNSSDSEDDNNIIYVNNDNSNISNNHFKFSDIIMEKIISFCFDMEQRPRCVANYSYNVLEFDRGHDLFKFSFVCKRVFQIIVKQLKNQNVRWHNQYKFNNEYSLMKQPPLYFDYKKISSFKHDKGVEYTRQFTSRVETFLIESDEYDATINSRVIRNYIYSKIIDKDV